MFCDPTIDFKQVLVLGRKKKRVVVNFTFSPFVGFLGPKISQLINNYS